MTSLSQERVYAINGGHSAINGGIGTGSIGPDIDEVFGVFIGGQHPPHRTGRLLMALIGNLAHHPTDAGQDIDGRVVIAFRQGAG